MSAPSPATHRLITTETGDPIVDENNRIILQRISDDELQYCLLTQDVINGFNLVVNAPTEDVRDRDDIATSSHITQKGASENQKNSEPGHKWTSQQIILFIRLVESNYNRFNEGLNKNVWLRIANELSSMTNKVFTAEQCDIKWKGLKRTYKAIKDHNNKSGNDRKKWEFFTAIDGFLGNKPEIEPLSVCSTATNQLQMKCEPNLPSTSSESEVAPRVTPSKRRRSGVDERHKEKMKKCDKFLKLFKKAVEHQTGGTISDDSE